MKHRALLALAALLILAACTKGGNVVYETDPADQASTLPLVTVVYDPNALGDRSYNDLIYQGVEAAALQYGLRTLQLSPSSQEEGLQYMQAAIAQMAALTDTIHRLLIVAGASYDDYLRENNRLLEANDRTVLYLGDDNTLFYPTSTGYAVNACRGYFQLKNGLTVGNPNGQNTARSFVLNFFDEETTGVTTPLSAGRGAGSEASWFTLDGRRLDGKPARSGLYIVGGRKVYVK